jgi:hypothetical protein
MTNALTAVVTSSGPLFLVYENGGFTVKFPSGSSLLVGGCKTVEAAIEECKRSTRIYCEAERLPIQCQVWSAPSNATGEQILDWLTNTVGLECEVSPVTIQ